MSTKVFLVAPARAGAGLLNQVLLLDKNWGSSPIGNPSALAAFLNPATPTEESEQSYSHRLTEKNLIDASKLPAAASAEVELAYNPRLALQVPFLATAYPEAKFIYVARNPLRTIASASVAWSSSRFVTEPELPGWWGEKWSFALTPNWKELIGKPVAEIVVKQWATTVDTALDDLELFAKDRYVLASFEALLENPAAEIERVTKAIGVNWNGKMPSALPPSPNTLAPKQMGKRQMPNGEVLQSMNYIAATAKRLNDLRAPITPKETPMSPPEANLPASRRKKEAKSSTGTPFAYKFTPSFRELLKQAKGSIYISTYKTGHVINVRQDENGMNVDFMKMNKPMGMAFSGRKFAVGLEQSIKTWINMPNLGQVVEPVNKNNAVYVPRSETFTGDVAIHEMAFGTKPGFEGLWWINTKFSALCKQDMEYSWTPVWRPEWITEYSAEDRCHVNGLAMVEGRPKFVTALSQTNEAHGWRELKGTSGVIIDIESNKIVTSGLSMPHSPRWHNGKLWVLESGKGSIATVNMDSGEVTTVATLPGFTRGLSFIGKYAVIGLSQVRESVFKDLPVTEQTAERACGVWIVDTETGAIAGSMKFEGAIQEIFDVKLVPGTTWSTVLEPEPLTNRTYHLADEVLTNLVRPKAAQKPQPKNLK